MLRVLKSIFIAATLGLGAMAASQQVPADQLIFGNEGDNDIEVKAFDKPALSDLLTVEPRLSVFYDYLRQSETLVRLFALVDIDVVASLESSLIRMSADLSTYRSNASHQTHLPLYSHLKTLPY